MEADHDGDGKLSFEEFAQMVSNTVRGLSLISTFCPMIPWIGYRETNDTRRPVLVYSRETKSLVLWFCSRSTRLEYIYPLPLYFVTQMM